MAKKKKSNFKDTTQESVMSDFIQVDLNPAQIDLEDLIEEEIEVKEKPRFKDPKDRAYFKDPYRVVKLKNNTEYITNENLTEGVKDMLINTCGYCADDFED